VPDVPTRDGRNLRAYECGDPQGFPVVVHHGTPASGRLFRPHVEDARRRGIRLIGYDRPGCGGSTPHPGRTVAAAVDDVGAIADALVLDSFATRGISGGGRCARACVRSAPPRTCLSGRGSGGVRADRRRGA
jgi:pimeloyl-ACP methyl ester carboxylesterase